MAQPRTWGHTPIAEMYFGLITQESPVFRHGECQLVEQDALRIILDVGIASERGAKLDENKKGTCRG